MDIKILILAALTGAGSWSAAYAGPDAIADRNRVETALEADPYFYSAHVNVVLDANGVIILKGFVFGDWDLRDAIRIATAAAGGRRVVDDLSIEVGGRR
jgi:osmotically-inducible protein OsmY